MVKQFTFFSSHQKIQLSRVSTHCFILLAGIFFTVVSHVSIGFAQTLPVKEWDKSFGGTKHDEMYVIIQTNDGGYLLGGDSDSPIGGEKSQGTQGLNDYWVVKTDALGNKMWDKRFGGNSKEEMFSVLQTSDNGYLLGGWSMSGISGDQSQSNRGVSDYWVVKIDENGNKLWDKRYGGPAADELRAMAITSDGGFILAGESTSGIGGEKTEVNHGEYDVWVVKTDAEGNKQWDAGYGGIVDDRLNAIQQTPDGGYIIGSWTISPIGFDITQASRGSTDMWLVKTDANGVKMWDGRYGGENNEYLYSLDQTSDGGFILGGYTRSGVNGDVTVPGKGGFDFWMVKTDGNGIKQWDKRYGGNDDEKGKSIFQASDGGFIMGGWSESGISGDKTEVTKGSVDYWLVKTDVNGNKLWDLDFGASNEERLHEVLQTSDGGFVIAGHSYSGKNGDKSQASEGINDYWIVKLSGTVPTETFYADEDGDGFGNPAADTLAVTAPAGYVSNNTDCNDGNAAINPGAPEICNANVDDNCNGFADDNDTNVSGQESFYTDNDGDLFGSGVAMHACIQPAGTAIENDDCNNNNAAINPAAIEICNANVDDNCNGLSDDEDPSVTGQGIFYTDNDNDSYGAGPTVSACIQPAGTSLTTDDCNDDAAAINPAAYDACNGIDDNCNFVTDENPLAPPIITPSGTISACNGVDVILTTAYDPLLAYQWYKGNSLLAGETNNSYTTNKGGNFQVKAISAGDCAAFSATTVIQRFGKPAAGITPLGNLNICETGSVDLKANEGVGFLYQWLKGSSLIEGATGMVYTATAKGSYKVSVSSEVGCSKSSSAVKVTSVCREGQQLAALTGGEMNIYPNPADNHLVIELSLDATIVNTEAIIELVDLLGRTLQQAKVPVSEGQVQYDLVIADKVMAGTYFIKASVNNQLFVKTIVVQR